MQIVVERADGLDSHKKTVVAAVQTPEKRITRTFGTMTRDLEQLAAWLKNLLTKDPSLRSG